MGQITVLIAASLFGTALFAVAAIMTFAKKFLIATILVPVAALLTTFAEMAIFNNFELPGFDFVENLFKGEVNTYEYGSYLSLFLVQSAIRFFFYLQVAATVIALLSLNKVQEPKVEPLGWPTTEAPIASPIVTAASAAAAPITQRGNTNMAAQWEVMIPGASDPQVDTATLQVWAMAGRLKPNTLVKEISTGATYTAAQIPGVFSEKQFVTALILSILLGSLGIDRFYTGHVGLGVGKLLTLGGCGIWAIVDIILYATRKVNDSDGRPLQ